eukprot:TRINITY_DN42472_c0_g2_i1.p1 TRINITY_DN42472_c0_g2~~TRINITY_DN42472_c0_g2_i1.p1  ORF type:complete len:324 (+),score=82.64 TRINITY_DN42472_c0_g2_i1:108-974(+)
MGCVSSKKAAAAAAPIAPAAGTDSPKVDDEGDVTSEQTRVPSEGDHEQSLPIVVEIAKNVLIGFLGEELPAVLSLLQASGDALQGFKAAVEAFRAREAAKGLEQLSDSLQMLAKALSEDAATAKEQAEGFASVLAMFRDPAQIFHAGEQLLVNGKDVLARIQRLVAAFDSQDWQTFGQEIGGIIGDLLAPAAAESQEAAAPASPQAIPTEAAVQVAPSSPPGNNKGWATGSVVVAPDEVQPQARQQTIQIDGVQTEEDADPVLFGTGQPVARPSAPWPFGACCAQAAA